MATGGNAGFSELESYFKSVSRVPLMTPAEEGEVARSWRATGRQKLADRLVSANLRFVIKIALEYRNYGFPIGDLVQEGNVGLVRAVRSFDPDRGYRLISYAVWWIRAYIQEYILKSWSLVKIGTTQLQRRLFNNMQSSQKRIRRLTEEGQRAQARAELAAAVGGTVRDVEDMERRLQDRDLSLDATATAGGSDPGPSLHEKLCTTEVGVEELLEREENAQLMRRTLADALGLLDEREQYIVRARHLRDKPSTLRELGDNLGISKERVRQLEDRAIRALRTALDCSPEGRELAAA